MKKSLIALVIVLSMLVAFVGTVSAAPLASGTATLVSVDYIPGKGPVFTFAVNGEFSKSELKGYLHIEGDGDFELHCSQVDSNMVKCTVSKKATGKNVVLSWGGSTFWTAVPVAPEFCYSVYDWNVSDTSIYTNWVNYGSNCQERPAKYGDLIEWYNPGWGDTFTYEYLPGSPGCFAEDVAGDSYYYPSCPSAP